MLLAGLTGSLLVTAGGTGAGALPRPAPGSWLGLTAPAATTATRTVALVAVWAGVAILGAAWWRARRALAGVLPRALVRATALWSLPLLVGPPVFSRDVFAYGGQAAVAARGLDPYTVGPIEGGGSFSGHVDLVWQGTPSPYGPAFLWPASLLFRLTGGHVTGTVLLLRLLAVLGLALTAWALLRLSRRTGVPAQQALWLGAANPLGLLHGVAGAHNDALMVGLMLAGVALGWPQPSHRSWVRLPAAGALVALAVLVKAPAVAALPVLVLAQAGWRSRARAAALLAAGAAVVAGALPVLTGLGWGWLSTLSTGRSVLSLFSPATGLGTALGAAAGALGVVDDVAAVREPVLSAVTVAGALAAGALLLLTRRLGPLRALGLALLTVVALSPTVLPWYALWGVVPLAAAGGRRTAAALGVACLVLCFTVYPSGRSVVRPPLYGVPLVAAAAAGAVAARRVSAAERDDRPVQSPA